MALLRKSGFVILGLLYHVSLVESLAAQYCHSQTAQEPIPFCVATETTYNTTTQATDMSVTFAYQKSPYGGWGAIGLGDGMYGALMFVTYDESPKEDGNTYFLSGELIRLCRRKVLTMAFQT